MQNNDTKRLSRLVAILTQLQTKRLITSTHLAKKFGVSVRTIYRDIKALEQAGVPVLAEEGKGFSLMEGYKMPPVMFTENETNALITAEHLVLKNGDSSLIKQYSEAIDKIKSLLLYSTKEKVEFLSKRVAVSAALPTPNISNSLSQIQHALTNFKVLHISYHAEHKNEKTARDVEPFALYYSSKESWTLIAYCRMRKDYRMFRLDRIYKIDLLQKDFTPHKLSLEEYLLKKEKDFTTPDIPLS